MRWDFFEPGDSLEEGSRQSVLEAIGRWWEHFAGHSRDLDAALAGRSAWDLPAWITEHLGTVDPRLMWEFGPARGEGHRLVITPEAHTHLRPLVRTMLARAPKLPMWEFSEYRPPASVDTALGLVEQRVAWDASAMRVRVRAGKAGRVDLTYVAPAYQGPKDDKAQHAAFVLTESLLGEEIMDKWVGAMDVDRDATGHALALGRLHDTVVSLTERCREQLPARRWSEAKLEGREYTLLRCKPEAGRADYPGWDDLLSAVTLWPELWHAAHEEPLFFSERFSRCDEHFAYLKVDRGEEDTPAGGSGGGTMTGPKAVSRRKHIEDAVATALGSRRRTGQMIGAGSGLRYDYIDVVLEDLRGARDVLRAAAREAGLPRRSWLMFYDADWGAEWVGLHPDSPPPPMRQG